MSNGPATSHASSGTTMLSIAPPHHAQEVYHTYPLDQALQQQHHQHQQQQQRYTLLPLPHPQAHSLPLPLPLPPSQAQATQAYQTVQEEAYVFCHYRPIMPHRIPSPPRASFPSQDTAAVRQALEMARESPDGAQDPTICKILEVAITSIWGRVQDKPDTYVMDRDEFAVFNYFQHRFKGDTVATAARKRYWDNLRA